MTAETPCGRQGPRIGSDSPVCVEPLGHRGPHLAHESWGDVAWPSTPLADNPTPASSFAERARTEMAAAVTETLGLLADIERGDTPPPENVAAVAADLRTRWAAMGGGAR